MVLASTEINIIIYVCSLAAYGFFLNFMWNLLQDPPLHLRTSTLSLDLRLHP